MPAPKSPAATSPRVGLVHVPYQVRGGEDAYVEVLARTYRELGYETHSFEAPSRPRGQLRAAMAALNAGDPQGWDLAWARSGTTFLHVHNIHPSYGPAFLRWLASRRHPALFTIHNHRFFCTNGLALYGGEICKACKPAASAWRPVAWNCNASRAKSAYHALALRQIRGERLLERAATALLAPSQYIARELVEAGVRGNIRVLPHGADVAAADALPARQGADVLFVGRLAEEKGIRQFLLLAAAMPEKSFLVIGSGPLAEEVRAAGGRCPNLEWRESPARPDLLAEMRAARVVCVPSLCEESYSLVSAEALALGCQLVVADNQSLRGFCEPPFAALPAPVRDPAGFASVIREALALPPRKAEEIRALRERLGTEGFRARLGELLRELGL